MRLLSFFPFLIVLLLPVSSVHALDAVFVQAVAVKPYEQVFTGFRSAFSGQVKRIILSESLTDPVQAVRAFNPDVIVAVGTEALTLLREIDDIPIVYAMVLNPAPLVEGSVNITGIGMMVEPDRQLAMFRKLLPPSMRRIGVVHDPRRVGKFVAEAMEAARRQGLELVVREVTNSAEVAKAADSLQGIDAFWLLPDQTVIAAGVEKVFAVASANHLPVLAFSSKYLREGALLTLDLDTEGVGKQAAEMAEEAVPGAETAAIISPGSFLPKLSQSALRKLGMPLKNDMVRELGVAVVE